MLGRVQKQSILLLTLLSIGLFGTSCGDGSDTRNISIPGVDGPTVTLQQDNVLISFIFEKVSLDAGLRYPIPKYPNSYIEISPDLQSGGTLMSISISLDDVFNGELERLDPQSLPGGRALPGVAEGRLPAVAFTIEKFKGISFYLGPKIFGVFVPLKESHIGDSILTARFYSSGSRVGNISYVGHDENEENAGILLMLDMGRSTKKKLKKLSRKY